MINKKKVTGAVLLVVLFIAAIFYGKYDKTLPDQITATGLVGSEKLDLFNNEEFKELSNKNYGITYNVGKSGSYDQIDLPKEEIEKYDFLFPSTQLASEIYKEKGFKATKEELVFNTPIVLYTRNAIADALVNKGVVSKNGNIYNVNMKEFAKLIESQITWEELGVSGVYGNVLIDTTDPSKTDSGVMFLGLLANSLNDGKVVDSSSIEEIKPQIISIYNQLGYMQATNTDMFNQFLRQGVGAFPIIAGYENQYLEFSKQNSNVFNQVKDDVVILYPTPTVWTSHVLISRNEKGNIVLESLMDSDIQKSVWKNHGFRTGVSGTNNLEEYPEIQGLPKEITNVMPMPTVDVMNELIESVK